MKTYNIYLDISTDDKERVAKYLDGLRGEYRVAVRQYPSMPSESFIVIETEYVLNSSPQVKLWYEIQARKFLASQPPTGN